MASASVFYQFLFLFIFYALESLKRDQNRFHVFMNGLSVWKQ